MQFVDAGLQINPFTIVVVTVTGNQNPGFDLAKPVQHPGYAEIRGAR